MTQYTNQVALSTTGFTDLGAGPLQIGANAVGGFSSIVIVVVADAQPSAGTPGELLNGSDTTPYLYNTTSHVWAKAATGPIDIEVTSGLAAVGAGSAPTTIADGADVAQGTTTDAAWGGTGAGTLVALGKATAGAFASLVATALGKAFRVVLVDPATGNASLVQAFHNSDNQAIGSTSYGLFTGGVDQLINAAGNLDRKRGVAGDAMAATGLAADVSMVWNGATYDRAPGDKTNGTWVNVKAGSVGLQIGGAAVAGGNPVPITGTVTVNPQRVESLWTDDSGAYYVRVDLGGTITWTDPSGNILSAPGTGARPAAGATVLLSSTAFQATTAGTGYAIGDYLSHFVTTDPTSGAVLGNFWVDLTTGAKLAAAPTSANVTPVAPLPTGAALDASVQAVKTALGTPFQAGGSVSQTGTTGTDFSANAPAIPNVGANFGSTGPYANYVLVKTIAAGARNNVEVKNTSGAQIVIVRDDGTAANGAAPTNASVFSRAGGSGVGSQGGDWSSTTFKGRLQIYAPASAAQVTAFVD